jgi:hypothetical protein
MSLNRREILRWGLVGAGGAMLSSAATSAGLPSIVYSAPPVPPRQIPQVVTPAGIDPMLFQRTKAALDSHRIAARD